MGFGSGAAAMARLSAEGGHAIAQDEEGAVIDPFDGLVDLAQRRLRTPLSPEARANTQSLVEDSPSTVMALNV